jgi:excisionase family DNA binding protein
MRAVAGSDWLTLGEASSYLGVAPATTRKWSDQGRLPVFYTPGGHRRFQRAALDEFISGGRPHSPYITPLVLVIGGDDTLRLSLRVRLDELGYDVRLSDGSTTSSLTALEGRAPSLVLLDVAKLESKGWQLLRQIEEQHGSVHVIMFDSQSGGDPRSEQPFDLERLVAHASQTLPI